MTFTRWFSKAPASGAALTHWFDAIWCDVHGVFVSGWGHFGDVSIDRAFLRSGSWSAAAELDDRPDVLALFPSLQSARCGFHAYLECEPFKPVTLEFGAGTLSAEVSLTVPRHAPTELAPSGPWLPPAWDQFVAEMKGRGGTVIEIGARVVGPHSTLLASHFQPECHYVGVDIHSAPGVDVVADAHFLADAIPPGSVDGVFSVAVFEHLAAPWLVSAEINRVLKLGGLSLQSAPQTFPIHETPNDFFRMSDEAFKVLFGLATGFEVIQAGMEHPVTIVPEPADRWGALVHIPRYPGMASSYILARKVAEIPPGSVCWPISKQASQDQSQAYPSHMQPDG